jgi:HAE1 family hydrophobic/amphiphilic exporter-1
MRISDFAVNRPVTTVVIFAAVIVLGLYSLSRLAIDLIPEIDNPVLTIYSNYPGVSPEEVEENLTKVLENAAASVTNVKKITSRSREGQSIVIVEFEWGTDMGEAAAELREKIDVVRDFLPDEASQPIIEKFDPSQVPVMVLVLEGKRDLKSLRYQADNNIKANLEQIDGVANVMVWGGRERQVHVDLDRTLLASYGLTVSQVVNLVKSEHVNVAGGNLDEGGRTYTIRTLGKFRDVEDLRSLVVGRKNDAPVYLRDVARVYDGYVEENVDVRLGREDALIMVVLKQSGTNTVQISRLVRKKLRVIEEAIPSDMSIGTFFSPADFIVESINNVWQVALIGGVLAVVIIFVFLRNISTTLVISVSIPLSLITTFIFMYFFDLTINMMSLGGLALGIGMLVDNSIVVLENIFRYRAFGAKPGEASRLGASEMSNAIIASTLTTITVFLPLVLFIKGLASELFRDLAFTVTFALLSSLVVALTVIPMLTSRIRRVSVKSRIGSLRDMESELASRGRTMRAVDGFYSGALDWALSHRWVFVGIVVAALAASVFALKAVSFEFMPQSDESFIEMRVKMPVGTEVDYTRRAVDKIYDIIDEKVPEKDTTFIQIGRTGEMQGTEASNQADIWMTLVDINKRKRSDQEIIDFLRKEIRNIPGAEVRFSTGGGGGTGGSSLNVSVSGYDLKEGAGIAGRIAEIMRGIGNVSDVRISREEGMPEYQIRVDRERAAQFGVSVAQVGTAVDEAFAGEEVATIIIGGEEVSVLVRLEEKDRLTREDLDLVSVMSATGARVPLSNIARIERGSGPVVIEREHQQRVVYVQSRVKKDIKGAVDSIRGEVSRMSIPAGFTVTYGGSWEDLRETMTDLALVMILAIILVYLIMAALFESFRDPFVIMFTMLLLFVGVVWTHVVTGTTVNAISGIGVVLLAGIVVNNGILLVDYTNLLRRRGYPLFEAVRTAGRIRLRPILMTMLTTVLGLLPMALGFGEGSEMRAPMARTVIGGLLVSTIFTVLFIPVVYSLFEGRREKKRAKRAGAGGDGT